MTNRNTNVFKEMYIDKLNINDRIFQIVSPEFKGIGIIAEYNKEYIKMIPHNDEDIEKDWPGAGVTYPIYIPTAEIKLMIVLKGKDGTKESNDERI
tara:strand:+ start:94 stop:381 length:288 start_codon:yes stop_codon:yes gene_type:complete